MPQRQDPKIAIRLRLNRQGGKDAWRARWRGTAVHVFDPPYGVCGYLWKIDFGIMA